MPKAKLDFDSRARGLGAERRGPVVAGPGYFGAAQLAAELARRLRVPAKGGRATDPAWTERRIVPLSHRTLDRLHAHADRLDVEPMQLAALLIENGLDGVEKDLRAPGSEAVRETPTAASSRARRRTPHPR